jgi:glycosyltransferase involved in cell wall biosynthesis
MVLLAGYDGPPLSDDHPVRMVCRDVRFYPPPSSAQQVGRVRSALASLLSPLPYTAAKFSGRAARRSIREILESERFDLILANFAFLAYLVPADLARHTPMVLDEHESEGLLYRQYLRQGGLAQRAFALLNLGKLFWYQKAFSSRIVAMLSASDREADFARTFLPHRVKLWTVPNGVDTNFFTPSAAENQDRPCIVFCAGFAVYRSCEAALWFTRQVFPLIKKAIPDAELWLVGSSPPAEVRQLAEFADVHVTGTVEDVRPFYARATVAVTPYRYATGVMLKLFEAMASGVPLVSTTIGCQGIDVRNGQHLLVADTANTFADRVIELLRNPGQRRAMAACARHLIEREYSWKKIVGDLEPRLADLALKYHGSGAAGAPK